MHQRLIDNLDKALHGISKFMDVVGEITKKIREKLKGEVPTDIRSILLECRVQLRKSLDCANVYMKRVERLYKFADLSTADVNKIKSAINSDDFEDYMAYIKQISRYIEQVDKLYSDFKEIHDKAAAACEKGRTKAEVQIKQHHNVGGGNRRAGTALKVLGTVSAVGGVAGLATVAGIFTAGIGAPIVLGIAAVTAGGAAAAGAGVAAGGVALSRHGEQARSSTEYNSKTDFLSQVKNSFDLMVDIAREVDLAMYESSKIVLDMKLSAEVAGKADRCKLVIAQEFKHLVEGFKVMV